MAMSLEEMQDNLEEMEMKLETKFDALENFTLNKLKSIEVHCQSLEERVNCLQLDNETVNLKDEFGKLDESLGSLRSDFEAFKSCGVSSSPISDGPEDGRKQKKTSTDETSRKKFRGFSFKPLSCEAGSKPAAKIPYKIDDIENVVLKNSIKKYYDDSDAKTGCKLTPAQSAYFEYIMMAKFDGFTARRSAIDEAVQCGEKDGFWPRDYKPEGIKNSFREYLRDRAKNCQKKS